MGNLDERIIRVTAAPTLAQRQRYHFVIHSVFGPSVLSLFHLCHILHLSSSILKQCYGAKWHKLRSPICHYAWYILWFAIHQLHLHVVKSSVWRYDHGWCGKQNSCKTTTEARIEKWCVCVLCCGARRVHCHDLYRVFAQITANKIWGENMRTKEHAKTLKKQMLLLGDQ